ncbi:DUF6538 domain-containing protein [Sphingomonas sp. Tas61C01]|uniref:DUF6538 domain-containing protein n=1 Tax=Sphingomonas sp. Tas61C01 TaxID=3458297 RepID=UPI00403E5496
MSGSRVPHLQIRNGIYHLRLRGPEDVRPRLRLRAVRRSLSDCGLRGAEKLAVILAAKVREAFDMIKCAELDSAAARQLVQRWFEDRIRDAECRGA